MDPNNPGHVSMFAGLVASVIGLTAMAAMSPSLALVDGLNAAVGSYSIAVVVTVRILMPGEVGD